MKVSHLCYTEVVFVSQSIQNFESLSKHLSAISPQAAVYIKEYADFFEYGKTGPLLAILDLENISTQEMDLLKKSVCEHKDLFILICEPADVKLIANTIIHPNVVKIVKPFYPIELEGAAQLVGEQFIRYRSEEIRLSQSLYDVQADNAKLCITLEQLHLLHNRQESIASTDIHVFFEAVSQTLLKTSDVLCAGALMFDDGKVVQCAIADSASKDSVNHSIKMRHVSGAIDCFKQVNSMTLINTADKLDACKSYLNLLPGIHSLLVVAVELKNKKKCYLFTGRADKAGGFDATDKMYLRILSMETKQFIDYRLLRQELEQKRKKLYSLKLHERQLNRSLEETQSQLLQSEKMASLGQLAAGVAHEINNPVGYIKSNLGSLDSYVKELIGLLAIYEQTETSLSDPALLAAIVERKKAIDIDYIKKDICELLLESAEGVNRVKNIVRDLKNFSHTGEEQWQEADIHAGLESTLNIVRNEIKYKAKLVCNYAELPPVKCILSQLNQVFMNMLVNACQAIDDHGEIRIETGCQGNEWVWIRFSDSGKGVEKSHLNKLFDPFFTTKPVGQGTGLGLSISRDIVNKHGGVIDVESVVGKGTSFTIRLPVNQHQIADDSCAQTRQAG